MTDLASGSRPYPFKEDRVIRNQRPVHRRVDLGIGRLEPRDEGLEGRYIVLLRRLAGDGGKGDGFGQLSGELVAGRAGWR